MRNGPLMNGDYQSPLPSYSGVLVSPVLTQGLQEKSHTQKEEEEENWCSLAARALVGSPL